MIERRGLGVDEDRIGTGFRVRCSPAQRLAFPPAGDERLGPGDDDEIRTRPRRPGRLNLARVLVDRNEFALNAGVEAAPFGEDVVFDTDTRGAGAGVFGDRPHDVDRVAEAVVAVGDDRDVHRVAHAPHRVQRLTHGENVGVGQRVDRGDAETAGPDGVEAGFLGEFGRQGVVGAQDQARGGSCEQRAQSAGRVGRRHGRQTIGRVDG